MLSSRLDAPRLYLLVATDPTKRNGAAEKAQELVAYRLAAGLWPLYERTPNRKAIGVGADLAFYVGGSGSAGGCVVATARVLEKRTNRAGRKIDPPGLGTEPPDQILVIHDIRWLTPPMRLKQTMLELGLGVENLGNMLQGGCRALTEPTLVQRLLGHPSPPQPRITSAEGE